MKKTKLFRIVPAVLISLCLVGCPNSSNPDNNSGPNNNQGSQDNPGNNITNQEVYHLPEGTPWKDITEPAYNKTTDGPLNISITTNLTMIQPADDNKIYKWMEDTFGVTFEWTIPTGTDDQKDQFIDGMIATGELTDIVEVYNQKYQNAGVLRDLKPLIEKYCPNLYKHYFSVWPKMIDTDSERDWETGDIIKEHIYSLPNWGVYDGVEDSTYYNQYAWWVQKAVLKEYGYPKIKTVDEYFDFLKKYSEKYPTINNKDTIPFSMNLYDWHSYELVSPGNFLAGYPNDGYGHVEIRDGIYRYVLNYTCEEVYKWFRLANKYYNQGLIDESIFTDTSDQYFTKMKEGRVLGMFTQGWEFNYEVEPVLRESGMEERTYVPLPLTFDKTIKPHYRDQSLPNLQRGFGITVTCPEKKAIKILKFMDIMLEEENQKMLYWGIEGEDYSVDAYGKPYRTTDQINNSQNPVWQNSNKAYLWSETAPKLEGRLESGYTLYINNLPWENVKMQMPSDVEVFNAYNVGSYAELMDPNPPKNAGWYPLWQCNPYNGGSETAAYNAYSKIDSTMMEYAPDMIMGKASDFDAVWQEYLVTMNGIGEPYVQFMQTQLNNRLKRYGGYPE